MVTSTFFFFFFSVSVWQLVDNLGNQRSWGSFTQVSTPWMRGCDLFLKCCVPVQTWYIPKLQSCRPQRFRLKGISLQWDRNHYMGWDEMSDGCEKCSMTNLKNYELILHTLQSPHRKLTQLSPSTYQKRPPVSHHQNMTSGGNWSQRREKAWPRLAGVFQLFIGPRPWPEAVQLFYSCSLYIPHHLLYSWIKKHGGRLDVIHLRSYQNSLREL